MSMDKSLICIVIALMPFLAHGDGLKIFGPGGPAPAMKEVAKAYSDQTGIAVDVTAGPSSNWMADAKQQADAIFSGSQNMMDDFIAAHGHILSDSVLPLYLRPSTILVRKGNPAGITGIKSLLAPGIKIMVVDGAGQVGLWEDVVGRTGNIDDMRRFRANIAHLAPNSGAAKKTWQADPSLQAWLIWNHWQIDNPDIADQVAVEPALTIYRDVSIAQTEKGRTNPAFRGFLTYLQSDTAADIFAKHGWKTAF